MSGNHFHGKQFDNTTKLKLEIFRGYVREWAPVFLSPRNHRPYVNVYDFFAGPGQDMHGNPGSPLVILDEVARYLDDPRKPKARDTAVRLFFNDAHSEKIRQLERLLAAKEIDQRISIRIQNLDFPRAFANELPMIRSGKSANLVFLDQCGYKFIGPDVFTELINCPTTDIIFFVSSENILRPDTDRECASPTLL